MTALAHLLIEAENGPLSVECVDRGIISFLSFIEWVEQLPYQRNSDRANFALVIDEECGTCSTKNALVKAVAIENQWDQVQLFLGIYLMSEETNPGVGNILETCGLTELPEAHTYLKINGELRDVTGLTPGKTPFLSTLQTEIEIQPSQIGEFKVDWHKDYLFKQLEHTTYDKKQLWEIREACIHALANS